MKIYTFYSKISGFNLQEDILDLWKYSWQRKGFDPIVLDVQYARNHPDFNKFTRDMICIFRDITGKTLSNYGYSCFLRWLAYSMLNRDKSSFSPEDNECFFVSDYDVINYNWHPEDFTSDKLHFLDYDCPCLVFGSALDFDNFYTSFFDVTTSRRKYLNHVKHYHDQNFLTENFIDENNPDSHLLRGKYNVKMTRKQDEHVAPYNPGEKQTCKAFHVSHQNTHNIQMKFPEKFEDLPTDKFLARCRLEIIKEILNK